MRRHFNFNKNVMFNKVCHLSNIISSRQSKCFGYPQQKIPFQQPWFWYCIFLHCFFNIPCRHWYVHTHRRRDCSILFDVYHLLFIYRIFFIFCHLNSFFCHLSFKFAFCHVWLVVLLLSSVNGFTPDVFFYNLFTFTK